MFRFAVNFKALKQNIKVTFVFIFLLSLPMAAALAQQADKLQYESDMLEGGTKDGQQFKKLVGNVRFVQGKTTIYCDSAFAYDKTNSMEAFGHVRIVDLEDSVTITSERLLYDGNGRLARLRGNVVYEDDSVHLYTDNLDYDMVNKSATYFDGGKIVDGINTLESDKGTYDTEGKMMIFTDNVKMITPDYTLEAGNLVYNLITKIARTSSETTITTKDGKVLKSQQGSEFDTQRNTSLFYSGEVETESYYLKGDRLMFDNQLGAYTATGHVFVLGKKDEVIITGDRADFWQDQGLAKVYGNPLLKKAMNDDTLYLRADTLLSIDDSLEANKRLLAYHNVKIFKNDVQGKADSLAYFLADSVIRFYQDPVIRNQESQITADSIEVLVKNGNIDRMITNVNSFIISQDSTSNFNQIKGRKMIAYFDGSNIRNVDVTGNSESIYFIADEENPQKLIGMNRIICSNMKIIFTDNQVSDIRFYTNPEGKFIPPHELKEDLKKLDGFNWRIDDRPRIEEILSYVPGPKKKKEKAIIEEDKTKIEELLDKSVEEDIEKIKKTLKKDADSWY